MLTPERMAQIYGDRSGRMAFREVEEILRYFSGSLTTVAYWTRVMSYLQKRFAR